MQVIIRFDMNQRVEVFLNSNVWVTGLVMGVLSFFEKIAGWGYEIRYEVSNQFVTEPFPADPAHIRPCMR